MYGLCVVNHVTCFWTDINSAIENWSSLYNIVFQYGHQKRRGTSHYSSVIRDVAMAEVGSICLLDAPLASCPLPPRGCLPSPGDPVSGQIHGQLSGASCCLAKLIDYRVEHRNQNIDVCHQTNNVLLPSMVTKHRPYTMILHLQCFHMFIP